MKIRGYFSPRDGRIVKFGDEEIFPAGRHSGEFNWSYGGSGPAELAWVLMEKLVGRDAAEYLYQTFKWEIIAGLPAAGWELDADEIRRWADERMPAHLR